MIEHEHWLHFAEEDLKVARLILKSEEVSVSSALFHAQQCAEKAIKSYLVFHQIQYKRTHDLVLLVKLCAKKQADFEALIPLAAHLTPYATESRYPDSCLVLPTTWAAEESLQHATTVLGFIREKLAQN